MFYPVALNYLNNQSLSKMLKLNHVFSWIENAWGLFIQQPIKWIALIWIASLISGLTFGLIIPFLMAGIAFACQTQQQANPLKIQYLLIGFRQETRSLFLLCLLFLVALIVFYLVIELPIRSYIAQHPSASGLFIVLLFACQLLFSIIFWASTLVMLCQKTAFVAITMAAKTLVHHMGSILILNFIFSAAIVLIFLFMQQLSISLLFIKTVLLLLSLYIVLILFCGALYCAYQDLFKNQTV